MDSLSTERVGQEEVGDVLCISLTSQTQFHRKEGKVLVNYIYKPCPTALYSAVQSCCSICHMTVNAINHCLSGISSLKNCERELGHLFCYCSSCKNTSTILVRECAYSATGIIQECFTGDET